MPSTRKSYLDQVNGADPTEASASPSRSAAATNQSRHVTAPKQEDADPLRSQWEFAALWQFLYTFHAGLRIPFYEDIQNLENDIKATEGSPLLHDVQVGLLKNVSSQRGLTIEQFEDYTRRQYIARSPDSNPFGNEVLPLPFSSFNAETKVQTLYQLCLWIISNPERFRERVDPHKTLEQSDWRIDPIGWDSKGNTYYQLDDLRLYCRIEPPVPVYQKWKSRAKSKAGRAAKRRKLAQHEEDDEDEDAAAPDPNEVFTSQLKWKCVCSCLEDYKSLVARFEKSRDPDEKDLRDAIIEDILPIFEKEELKRQRKLVEQEKEQARLLLLAGRKRSARVDERAARQREAEEREVVLRVEREEREKEEKEEKHRREEEETRIAKLEERERRLQERELRANLRREEKARLLDPDATESEPEAPHAKRKSSRQKEKRKAEIEEEEEDEDWVFDCICGVHGINYDDGSFSIACDKCGVWQHTGCLGLPETAAEENEFICDRCRDKALAAMSPPIKIKLRIPRATPSDVDGESQPPPPISFPLQNKPDVTGSDRSTDIAAEAHNLQSHSSPGLESPIESRPKIILSSKLPITEPPTASTPPAQPPNGQPKTSASLQGHPAQTHDTKEMRPAIENVNGDAKTLFSTKEPPSQSAQPE